MQQLYINLISIICLRLLYVMKRMQEPCLK